MMEQPTPQRADRSRPRNRVVVVFGTLGLVVPVVLYSLDSYVGRDLRVHRQLSNFLWSFAIPYLWPSAAVLLPASASNARDSFVFWTMSLVLNVAIYSAVGFAILHLVRFVSKLGTKSD
jgi:hypothetical protein